MQVSGKDHRTLWLDPKDPEKICIIDQRFLPHEFQTAELATSEDVFNAIRDMRVRGAPLIGVTAAYGMYLAAVHALRCPEEPFETVLEEAAKRLISARPTAVNLSWAVEEQRKVLRNDVPPAKKKEGLLENANRMAEEDVNTCRRIGEYGLAVLRRIHERKKGEPVNILTHCNAGWLACVDWGTATAPVYQAHDQGLKVHVWVDETRPRNQGASLTAWELGQHGVPYTLIADNAGGHLMQHGKVDLVLVGTDRTTRTGDVANKIGTYLKALAAKANGVPFYAAAPSSSIDWTIRSGLKEIPIEERSAEEIKYVQGLCDGELRRMLIAPEDARVSNYGFDVTPAGLVTGIITERGIAEASEAGLVRLFPERAV